ncbi:hypothetical protein C8R45DRAFT_927441 [Mycena sanguinolenta]|nr:hypothetical protein C8R45DRAFT_927441 [Mycena sanguinolenta]
MMVREDAMRTYVDLTTSALESKFLILGPLSCNFNGQSENSREVAGTTSAPSLPADDRSIPAVNTGSDKFMSCPSWRTPSRTNCILMWRYTPHSTVNRGHPRRIDHHNGEGVEMDAWYRTKANAQVIFLPIFGERLRKRRKILLAKPKGAPRYEIADNTLVSNTIIAMPFAPTNRVITHTWPAEAAPVPTETEVPDEYLNHIRVHQDLGEIGAGDIGRRTRGRAATMTSIRTAIAPPSPNSRPAVQLPLEFGRKRRRVEVEVHAYACERARYMLSEEQKGRTVRRKVQGKLKRSACLSCAMNIRVHATTTPHQDIEGFRHRSLGNPCASLRITADSFRIILPMAALAKMACSPSNRWPQCNFLELESPFTGYLVDFEPGPFLWFMGRPNSRSPRVVGNLRHERENFTWPGDGGPPSPVTSDQ